MAVIVETVRTVTLALLAVAIGAGLRSLPFLYAIAFVLGTLKPRLWRRRQHRSLTSCRDLYARANGHLNAANTAGEDFLGIGLGGLAFVALASLPFIFDSLSFAISAVLLMAALRPRRAPLPCIAPAPSRIGPGTRRVPACGTSPANRRCACALASNATLAFFQAMMMGVLVGSPTVLHVGGAGYGLMLSIAALGMVAGGVLTGRIVARIGNPGALIVGATGAGLAYLILAYSMVAPVAVAALALEGFSVILGRSAITTMRHELVPTSLQGRTNTVFRSVIYGVVPFGAVTGGLVAHLSSLQPVRVRRRVAVAGRDPDGPAGAPASGRSGERRREDHRVRRAGPADAPPGRSSGGRSGCTKLRGHRCPFVTALTSTEYMTSCDASDRNEIRPRTTANWP